MAASARSRFASKVCRRGEHELWTGAVTSAGAGVVRIDGKLRTAQRAAWEFAHGPVPDGARVRACAEERRCVRVDHLRLTGVPGPGGRGGAEARSRRRSGEVRGLILRAATEMFTELGYAATRTKDVAERSGVSEPVIFRHFSTKAELFEAAFVEPFSEMIDEYVRSWQDPAASAEVLVRRIVEGLFDLLRRHRKLLLTLVGAHALDAGDPLGQIASDISHRVGTMLRATQPLAVVQAGERGYRPLDPPVTVAAGFGMVFALALLDDWLFPSQVGLPDRERQLTELTEMILHGIGHLGLTEDSE